MSAFPGSPKLLRGGIVLMDDDTGAVSRIISLQYNPDSLSRTFQVKGVKSEGGDHVEALRLTGPPVETIKLEGELDATDLLEVSDTQATQVGIHPQIAVLETLIYPPSTQLSNNWSQANSGVLEIAPMEGPLTLFIFGPKRIVPVRITELTVTEEAFDTSLNPIRAKVGLTMRVLTTDDLGFNERGGGLFMTYLQTKEQLAAQNKAGTFGQFGITGIP